MIEILDVKSNQLPKDSKFYPAILGDLKSAEALAELEGVDIIYAVHKTSKSGHYTEYFVPKREE